jgi:hypothetical protein
VDTELPDNLPDSAKAEEMKLAISAKRQALRILAEIIADKYLREIKNQDLKSSEAVLEKKNEDLS